MPASWPPGSFTLLRKPILMLLSFMLVQLIKPRSFRPRCVNPYDLIVWHNKVFCRPWFVSSSSPLRHNNKESFCAVEKLIWLIYLIDSKPDSFLRFIEPWELSESSAFTCIKHCGRYTTGTKSDQSDNWQSLWCRWMCESRQRWTVRD